MLRGVLCSGFIDTSCFKSIRCDGIAPVKVQGTESNDNGVDGNRDVMSQGRVITTVFKIVFRRSRFQWKHMIENRVVLMESIGVKISPDRVI